MSDITKEQVVEFLSNLPVMEIASLVSELEEKWGVSAAPAMMVGAAAADAGPAEEKTEFDVVLNLADGAIGYLENDEENLKIFDLVASALKPGGKHLMGVCSGDYAKKHFPRRHWEAGSRSLSLADFEWDKRQSRMLYSGYTFKFGEALTPPDEQTPTSTRLYTLEELRETFRARGMEIKRAYGDYDTATPASDDQFTLLVYSQKLAGESGALEKHEAANL